MLRRIFLNSRIILTVIIINAFTILLGAFDNLTVLQRAVVTNVDNIITTLFIIEMSVKFREYGIRGYFSSNWNKMDFTLVVLSVPALISWILGLELSNLSFFLIFRVLRVFKSFRFLKFVPGIKELIAGIQRALKTSVIILLGFCIYIFIIGIFSTYLFQHIAPEHFSDPLKSFYSIFKIFTVDGWYEIPEQIAANTSKSLAFLSYLYFIFIVITGGIFGLSLVNSIFVDAMLSDNTEDISEKIDKLEEKIDLLIKEKKV